MYQKNYNGEITSIQAYIMIISIMIGSGILGLAREVAEISQQDAWISVLVNGIFVSIIMSIIVFTIRNFPGHNFFQYTSILLSKPIAYIITVIYIIYIAIFSGISIRFLVEMISTWFLPKTPIFVVSLIIVITTVYMTMHGLTTLARFNEVIIIMLIPFTLLVLVGLPEMEFINLRPIGGSGIKSIMLGVPPTFYAFSGFESIQIYYPYISNKQKPFLKYSVLSIFLVTFIYTITVLSQIALFGVQGLERVLYPSINYLGAVDFPLIERMEIFFTIFWIFTVFSTIGLMYFSGCILLQNVFTTKNTRFFSFLLAPIVFFSSLYPKNTAQVVDIGDIDGKIVIFLGFALPILLFISFLIRKKVGKL
ncbi:GerAB/ArcD/ProY family transporter [Alkaliphilus peptidifermentans]|uniref:Spore germination protein (Amino acid permease) n=1 Tax=Alkaliphilus peptidifermentans DSM 18978 TaxID=1120976 RepID=A0A1G5C0L0_9FIRM|nr:GerAB/ArcD/ProY family transporter [Alkaliphilus peptidifermentans]SCX95856.1 spore germination protein (amino acid permease) [Alkaliphilus peptidifermentans DSM 18978]